MTDERDSPTPLAEATRDAARTLLAADGHEFVLQPWQVAYLVAVVEGRTPLVPPGCGVGKGWLQARLDEAAGGGSSAGGPRRRP
jgi:hypothetical protein